MAKYKRSLLNFVLFFMVILIIILTMTGCVEIVTITSCPNSDPNPLGCSVLKLNYLNESYPYMTLLNEVVNECNEDISCLHVQGVCYDSSGNELGRNEMFLGEIPVGERMKFNLDVKTNSTNTNSCTIEIIEGAYK